MEKMPVYVGCSLTAAPEQFRHDVEELKQQLAGQNLEVLEFIGLTEGTAADVYRWDIQECVRKCRVMLAICDYPSIGLGWEMARATALGTPVLAVAHANAVVTRLVLGAAEAESTFSFRRYNDLLNEVPGLFVQLISEKYPSSG